MRPPILLLLLCTGTAPGAWNFDPADDAFDPAALLDLSYLNEAEAGQDGWVRVDANGDFVRGDGEPIRFWAVNTFVEREKPYNGNRNDPSYSEEPLLENLAPWYAKRGVNMVRLHAHINPPDPETKEMTDVNLEEIEWIWRTIGAMKPYGIYATVSPYWANTMESDDAAWEQDWNGQHHGLLFFEEDLQAAYKEWLRTLFTTPTDYLGGGTLAEEPALAIFQIQNEDSLLFWTVNNLTDGQADRLGKKFGDWALEKYGSFDAALETWGTRYNAGDDYEAGVLGFPNIWELTSDAKPNNADNVRLRDTLEFWTELMKAFNEEIERFVHEDLGCPVLVNATNWKTADTVLLNDPERYSYTANPVIATNRYFTGVHEGPNDGWAVQTGDFFTEASVLDGDALNFPLNLKQVSGSPMLITESTWVWPTLTAYEGPLLVSAYSSLTGFDAFYWFANGYDGFEPPRSANGWQPSQKKWICMTPDMAGQWPAAALAFRRGDIARGQPVVEEHRSLQGMWERRSPILAETPSYDPNRDNDFPDDSPLDTGVDPYAFLVGPVEVTYDSPESRTRVAPELDTLIEEVEGGRRITSITGQLVLDTGAGAFTVNAPRTQGYISREPGTAQLDDVTITTGAGECAVTVTALDALPLAYSQRVLVQVAARAQPTGWQTQEATFTSSNTQYQGYEILDYGGPPWEVASAEVQVALANPGIDTAVALDANGMPVADVPLTRADGAAAFDFPDGHLYVVLTGKQAYPAWRDQHGLESHGAMAGDPDHDGHPNLLEFVTGMDPLTADAGALGEARLVREGDAAFAEVHYRLNTEAIGYAMELQTSTDGAAWSAVTFDGVNAMREVVDSGESWEQHRARLRWGEGEAVKFVRVRVVDGG